MQGRISLIYLKVKRRKKKKKENTKRRALFLITKTPNNYESTNEQKAILGDYPSEKN